MDKHWYSPGLRRVFGVPGGATSEPSAFTTSSRFSSGKIQPSSVLFHWPPPIALSSSFFAKVSPVTSTQEPTWIDIFTAAAAEAGGQQRQPRQLAAGQHQREPRVLGQRVQQRHHQLVIYLV